MPEKTEKNQRPTPAILYGTAWKEERTEALVKQAIEMGFRALDTANQRKHYFEAGVGAVLGAAIQSGKVRRSDLFLQTKFTYQRGQDHRLPYDPSAAIETQVEQSFAKSLEHLRTDYLDSLVLHGPESGHGLTRNDWIVWRTFEDFVRKGTVRYLGVSNVSAPQLRELIAGVTIKPHFVQNRCYPSIGWDFQCRQICEESGVLYQGFSLIRDPLVMESEVLALLARKYKRTGAQIVYRWAQQSAMIVLTGTTNSQHMREALAIDEFSLEPGDLPLIENIGR